MNETILAQIDLVGSTIIGIVLIPDRITLFLGNGMAAIFGVEGDDVTLTTRPVYADDLASPSGLVGHRVEGMSHDVEPIRMTLHLSNGMSHKFHVIAGALVIDAFETPEDNEDPSLVVSGSEED